MSMPRSLVRAFVLALGLAVLGGCATTATTRLDASWRDPAVTAKQFRKILIITVSADEFVQADVQKSLAAQLKARGVNAVASGAYFTRYTAQERQRFDRVIAASDADAVLLARVLSTDSQSRSTSGLIIGMGGQPVGQVSGIGNVAMATFDPAHYVPPSDYTKVTVNAEATIFERKQEKVVWTARVRIDNAQDGDIRKTVAQYVAVLMDAGVKEGMF
jgi:hypothetical protein